MRTAQVGGQIGSIWHGFGLAGNLCENREVRKESQESAVWATWNLARKLGYRKVEENGEWEISLAEEEHIPH